MIIHEGSLDYRLTPPHDVLGKKTGDHLPGAGVRIYERYDDESYRFLSEHPVNLARVKVISNSIWIWARGKNLS